MDSRKHLATEKTMVINVYSHYFQAQARFSGVERI